MKPSKDTIKNTKPKKKYQITNWPGYNQALKQRGSLTLWIPDDITERWYAKKGRKTYTDEAIEVVTSLKAVYGQAWRQSEGLARSIFETAGIPLEVPDYSTLSRRAGTAVGHIRVSGTKQNINLILDSTGAKITGEGEWKTKKYGQSKHRRWKKIHVGIDRDGEVVNVEITDNDVHDAEVLRELLVGVTENITAFAGDGAYDQRSVYDTLRVRGSTPQRRQDLVPRQYHRPATPTRRELKSDPGIHPSGVEETQWVSPSFVE